jgi:dGTP triphosphohydrolase
VKITEKYDETKSVLATTQVELFASDAVVVEQSATEVTLLEQGACLKSELSDRRDDIHALLAKIDRCLDMETQRARHTAALTDNIKSIKDSFSETTTSFQSITERQSARLSEGVTDMLSKSRTTCESLRSSINSALTILIHDSKLAKDAMTASCDELNQHLLETNRHVTLTLSEVQTNLSKWLDDVDVSMKTTQEQLAEQSHQVRNNRVVTYLKL